MRQSEKILLAFLLLGIISLGSFVGWKYFNSSENKNTIAIQASPPSGIELQEKLEVSANPFYQLGSGKKAIGRLPLPQKSQNENKNIEETKTANKNTNVVPVVAANQNTNANLVPTSVKNSNTNVNPVLPTENTELFSFAIIGDSQDFEKDNPKGALQKAVSNITNANVDLVMAAGDLISSCDDNDCANKFNDWKSVISPILSKTKEVRGNHDRSDRSDSSVADKIWQDVFDLPTNGPEGFSESTYSFDFKNVHFVVIDSSKPEVNLINKVQRDWLKKDLAENVKENTFVFFHEPAYPVSSKRGESLDVNKNDRDALWKILKSHKVSAVFSGHEHIMSRRQVDGIYQFIIGNTDTFDHDEPKSGLVEYFYKGHHYAIVSVKGKEITVKIFKVDGTELNSFTLPS